MSKSHHSQGSPLAVTMLGSRSTRRTSHVDGWKETQETQMQETGNTWLVIHQIAEEMLEKGKRNRKKNKHHQLKNSTKERPNSRVVKLFEILTNLEHLELEQVENKS